MQNIKLHDQNCRFHGCVIKYKSQQNHSTLSGDTSNVVLQNFRSLGMSNQNKKSHDLSVASINV